MDLLTKKFNINLIFRFIHTHTKKMSRKSLQTPQNRRSMLGFGSATAKMKQMQKKPPEQKRLTYSANRSANMHGRK